MNTLLEQIRSKHHRVRLTAYIIYVLLLASIVVLRPFGSGIALTMLIFVHCLGGVAFVVFDNWVFQYYYGTSQDTGRFEPPWVFCILVLLILMFVGPSFSFFINNVLAKER